MHFLYSAENLTIILALPKVELRVINESLKTCNTTFELAPVSSEKMKYIFFPMSSIGYIIFLNYRIVSVKDLTFL